MVEQVRCFSLSHLSVCDKCVHKCTAVLLHCNKLFYTAVSCIMHFTILNYTTLFCSALRNSTQRCIALYYTVLHCTALHCVWSYLLLHQCQPLPSDPQGWWTAARCFWRCDVVCEPPRDYCTKRGMPVRSKQRWGRWQLVLNCTRIESKHASKIGNMDMPKCLVSKHFRQSKRFIESFVPHWKNNVHNSPSTPWRLSG